jgi:methenyltetrahydrofolate cyclohydrolase
MTTQPNQPNQSPQPASEPQPPSLGDQPIGAWLNQLAAKTPAPGGGAVAALVGAISAALGSMVIAYTRGKKAYAQHETQLAEAAARLERLRDMLVQLAEEDAAAYAHLNSLMRLPQDDPLRISQWEDAVAEAIAVPRAGVATATALGRLLESLVPISNRWLGSDLAIASDLSAAAARAFLWNVRVNLEQIEVPEHRTAILAETLTMVSEAQAACERVQAALSSPVQE